MEAASSTNTMETSYYGQLLWVIVVLIAIIAAIVLLVRWLGRKNQHFFQKKAMRVVGGVGLGPSKSIQIVEIGSKLYILGVGEDINVIDTLADPEEISLLMKQFELEGRETTTLFSTIETLRPGLIEKRPSLKKLMKLTLSNYLNRNFKKCQIARNRWKTGFKKILEIGRGIHE